MKKYKLILFDLDGVIIDSKTNMEKSWSAVQVAFEIDVPFEKYFELIGPPFNEIVSKLGLSNLSKEIKLVYDVVSSCRIDLVKTYDGIIEVIKLIKQRGIKIGLVTSKDETRTLEIVKKVNILFDVIECPDESKRGKPYPDQILRAILKCQADPIETLYIGDMEVDRECAKRAGIDYIHAEWGYGTSDPEILRASKPSDILNII